MIACTQVDQVKPLDCSFVELNCSFVEHTSHYMSEAYLHLTLFVHFVVQVVEAWKAAKYLNLADGNVWVVPTHVTTTTESDYMQHFPVGMLADCMQLVIYLMSVSQHLPVGIVLPRGVGPCALALLLTHLCLERSKLSHLIRLMMPDLAPRERRGAHLLLS